MALMIRDRIDLVCMRISEALEPGLLHKFVLIVLRYLSLSKCNNLHMSETFRAFVRRRQILKRPVCI